MDGPAIITQVTNPKEDEARSPVAGEKASQRNISLKKQRGRSILSSFFCCFRDYNVEPPPPSSPSVLPPLVEENGGLQKILMDRATSRGQNTQPYTSKEDCSLS